MDKFKRIKWYREEFKKLSNKIHERNELSTCDI